MSEQEVPTAPEHGDPPSEPKSDKHPSVAAAERFASLVGVLLEPFKKSLEEHQTAELEHHRRVEMKLKAIFEQEQSFGLRLTELERRVGHLEAALAQTDRPAAFADASEPGGDS